MEAKLCKEQALLICATFMDSWGVQDAKAIISGGKESSIPEEVSDILLSSIMIGTVSVSEDGKVVTQKLAEAVPDASEIVYKNHLKVHTIRRIQALPEEEQGVAIAMECASLTALQVSELRSRDFAVLNSITTLISFT